MKILSPNALIEFLPPNPEMLRGTLNVFESVAPVQFRDKGFCEYAVKEGFTRAECVSVGGTPAYLIAWHVTADGGLWIDIAQTLKAGVAIDHLFAAVDFLQARERCKYTRFLTMRSGLAELAKRFGYAPEAVVMVKGGK